MTLPTTAQLSIASPLPTRSSGSSVQAVRQSVGIAEISQWHIFHMRGLEAETILASAYAITAPKIGGMADTADGMLVRLRRDEFVLLTSNIAQVEQRLSSVSSASLLTLTDITHGRGIMALIGVKAHEVLPKVCGLDFADAKFPNCFAAQTSLAKVRTLIVRLDSADLPVYYLMVDRSLAAYVWDVVFDATQEFGGVALNKDSLKTLKE